MIYNFIPRIIQVYVPTYLISILNISSLPLLPFSLAMSLCVPMLPNSKPRSVTSSMPAIPVSSILATLLTKPVGFFTATACRLAGFRMLSLPSPDLPTDADEEPPICGPTICFLATRYTLFDTPWNAFMPRCTTLILFCMRLLKMLFGFRNKKLRSPPTLPLAVSTFDDLVSASVSVSVDFPLLIVAALATMVVKGISVVRC